VLNEGFQVHTVVSMKMAVLWVVALCCLVDVNMHFRGICCLHHQGDETLMPNIIWALRRYIPHFNVIILLIYDIFHSICIRTTVIVADKAQNCTISVYIIEYALRLIARFA
jgi:hypothetical protein